MKTIISALELTENLQVTAINKKFAVDWYDDVTVSDTSGDNVRTIKGKDISTKEHYVKFEDKWYLPTNISSAMYCSITGEKINVDDNVS